VKQQDNIFEQGEFTENRLHMNHESLEIDFKAARAVCCELAVRADVNKQIEENLKQYKGKFKV